MSDAEDLLELFDADFGMFPNREPPSSNLLVLTYYTMHQGILVIGEGAKILGPNEHGQDILIIAEYLRVKQFEYVSTSRALKSLLLSIHFTVSFR